MRSLFDIFEAGGAMTIERCTAEIRLEKIVDEGELVRE